MGCKEEAISRPNPVTVVSCGEAVLQVAVMTIGRKGHHRADFRCSVLRWLLDARQLWPLDLGQVIKLFAANTTRACLSQSHQAGGKPSRWCLIIGLVRGGMTMPDHVYRIIQVAGSSEKSLEDAIQNAVGRASRTLRQVGWFEVVETRGHVEGGKVAHYQVTLKVGFTLDDG